MFKKLWSEEPAVFAVILCILMISIIGLLVYPWYAYTHPSYGPGPGNIMPNDGFVPTLFNNPVEGNGTRNGGGWAVVVSTISATTTQWSSVTIEVIQNAMALYKVVGIKQSTANIYSVNTTAPTPKWFLYANTSLVAGVRYSKNGTKATPFPTTKIDSTYGTLVDLQTVQSAWFIVIDMDGSGTVSAGDMILVFENHSGTTTQEVGGTGWQLQLSVSGGSIGSAYLA